MVRASSQGTHPALFTAGEEPAARTDGHSSSQVSRHPLRDNRPLEKGPCPLLLLKKKKKIYLLNKWDSVDLRRFCMAREMVNEVRRQLTEWEKTSHYTKNRGLTSRDLQRQKCNNSKTNNTVK